MRVIVDKLTRQIVVATPKNQKEGFYRTVVLIIADDAKRGTIGLCINRPAPVIECVCGECPVPPFPLFLGGPDGMDECFFFLHDQRKLAGKKKNMVAEGVYLSCPHKSDYFTEGKAKMVTGFCRWDARELRSEIKNGWWLLDHSPDPALILQHDPKKLWKNMTPRHFSLEFSEN